MMSGPGASAPAGAGVALEATNVSKRFASGKRHVAALDAVSFSVRAGSVTGLIGPDGAGKTTLMRLAAGLLAPDGGHIAVLGRDATRESIEVQATLGYMPQRFGLYEDLTVQENLDLYADLQGITAAARPARYRELMQMTGLAAFTRRLAGRLSGGMKQKLGLACSLLRAPGMLLLDEPTVGVDPVSRRELWAIVSRLVKQHGVSVLLSTAYLDEAGRCDAVILLHEGRILDQGAPAAMSAALRGRTYTARSPRVVSRELQAELGGQPGVMDAIVQGDHVRLVTTEALADPGALRLQIPGLELAPAAPRFEDSFIALLQQRDGEHVSRAQPAAAASAPVATPARDVVIEVRGLTRRFGDFYAVDDVAFDVHRGEVFGLLGANGAGKSTTFRMLCGLLPATAGTLRVAGVDLRSAAAVARARVGYMSQRFSLYGNLSVRQNLEFFASIYGLTGAARDARFAWALSEFELGHYAEQLSGELPLGYKQRLALACALMHEPDILFLDEPTSGVDPLARREFWRRINALARSGVTVLITTHFMEEAEYCDRLAIMAAGRILALGEPAAIKARAGTDGTPASTMEEAFIHLIDAPAGAVEPAATHTVGPPAAADLRRGGAAMRLRGLVRKEFLQIVRDPSSIAIAFLMPLFLLLLFGYGVSLDARHVPLAVVIEDPSPDTASFVSALEGSPYFAPFRAASLPAAIQALDAGQVNAIVHLRSNFAERMRRPDGAAIQLVVNGIDANTARLTEGYVEGAWSTWLAQRARAQGRQFSAPVEIEQRVWFNSELRSRNYLVPGLVVVIMTLIGALLTAMVMAREWERGTLEVLIVTPASMSEVLLGKLIPYFVLGTGGMLLSVAMARWLFEVPLRGSLGLLFLTSSLFLLVALGMGLLISTLAKNQFIAGQIAIIVTFLPAFLLSGFIFDIGSMPAVVRGITHLIAARYFVAIVNTLFLAGDVGSVIWPNALALAAMATVFLGLTWRSSRKRLE